jgi:hypothetical protein
MNTQLILKLLEQFGLPALASQIVPAIQIKIATNPVVTDAQLVADEDGSLKHMIRGRIGWLVDFIWPDIQPTLDEVITQAAADARAHLGTVNPT